MVQHLLQPQEIEVFYIIPTLRNQLAIAMKELGMKQKKIAELLSIEPATVSQYINKRRGNKINFEESTLQEIKTSAPKIKDRLTLLREMQHLLRHIKESKEMCKIHKLLSDIPSDCSPELIKCFGGGSNVRNAGICS